MASVLTHAYYKYWGKAQYEQNRSSPNYHLLPYHCLDVAAVGNVLLKKNQAYREKLVGLTGLDTQNLIVWYPFLLALHDIGKFADSFQNLRPDILQNLQGRTSSRQYGELRHDSLGKKIWEKRLRQQLQDMGLIPEITRPKRRLTFDQPVDIWMNAMVGHHGQPPKSSSKRLLEDDFNLDADFNAAFSFIAELAAILLPDKTVFPECRMERIKLASWWLAGLAVLCDWVGSNTQFFPYEAHLLPLQDYWQKTKKQAERAVREINMLNCQASLSLKLDDLIQTVENETLEPTPLQALVSEWRIKDSPHLFILEDVTGSGKTEAAILLAHRLMRANLGNSLYFALPTMATANSMYSRIAKVYRSFFSNNALPSVVLAHGARDMSEEFQRSILPSEQNVIDDYGDGTVEAGAHCNAWLADNRKKAMLADVGIGTIDQALLAILPSRHQSLRLLGLANKILLVDEVHACDSYMHELLCALLRAHAASGGSAILLSATLPKKQRQALLSNYAEGCGWSKSQLQKTDQKSYPLISCLSAQGLSEKIVDTRKSVRRTVGVRLLSSKLAIYDILSDAIAKNQCVCWIRNTVKDAVRTYQELRELHPDWQIDLFHARYALGDRLEIEERILRRFGKSSVSNERQKQILIATQVVEQSLDLDFDVMLTDLAPIDLLIQRAGRLLRHTRDRSGNPIQGKDQRGQPELYIYTPNLASAPSQNWFSDFFENAKKVYENHGQLWLSADILNKYGRFRMPEDARVLIETVYDAEAEIPEALLQQSVEAEGTQRAQASIARLNALSLQSGYTDSSTNRWWDEAITPTRLGEETTIVYLAKWAGGILRPWRDVNNHGWRTSAVSMRTYWIAEESVSAEILQEHMQQVKAGLPAKGRWGILLPLVESSDGCWRGRALNSDRRKIDWIYDKKFGLQQVK